MFFSLKTGTLFARATYDANRCVHPVAVAHVLCGECIWGYENLMAHEKMAYGEKIIGKNRVTIVDGGTSLKASLKNQYPENQSMRCSRHLQQDLKNSGASGRAAIATLIKIGGMSRRQKNEVRDPTSLVVSLANYFIQYW